jgi:hypothetical protein
MSTLATDLSYPIGRFDPAAPVDPAMRGPALEAIAELPQRMRDAVAGLTDAQLDTPYRPGGWTVRQLVHHVADSHMNGFIRTKLALTEDVPTVKPYDQDEWVKLADVRLAIDVSLGILDGIHRRWATVWQAMAPEDFSWQFEHPEIGTLTLDTHLQLYGWHSRHHVAHIMSLRQRERW